MTDPELLAKKLAFIENSSICSPHWLVKLKRSFWRLRDLHYLLGQGRLSDLPGAQNRNHREVIEQAQDSLVMTVAGDHGMVSVPVVSEVDSDISPRAVEPGAKKRDRRLTSTTKC